MKSSGTLRRAVTVAAVLLTALVVGDPGALAAPGAPNRAAAARAAGLESSIEDRVRAAAVVGVVAPDSWLVLNERDFVFQLWQNATNLPEVRGSAELALMNSSTDDFVECTVFIESGIHDAKNRDVANEVRDATAAREARELKQRALITVQMPVTPELLLLADREFVYEIYRGPTGPRVKAAALTAFGGTAQQQRDFITTGIAQAREQDRLAEIAADQERTEAERQALREREERIAAAAVLGVAADEGKLVLSDVNFVRWVWNTAAEPTEVYAAAEAALRSNNPADWRAFITTGIHAADERDRLAALKKKAEEYRVIIRGIEARAEAAGQGNLARAARAALAGPDSELAPFVRVGQYQVSDNECANPVLGTDAAGWGRLSSSLVVTRQAVTDHPSAAWELGVANGAATTAGIYLPEQKVQPGAVWEVGADARTNDPARLRMEIDWQDSAGVYLGHTNGGYLPVAGTRAFTRISGRFTVPAGAVRAKVLLRATELDANKGFAATMCAYKATPDADVKLTGTWADGTATAMWTTRRTDIIGWNVGRDGTDTRESGPWSTERTTDISSHQFNLLKNGSWYSLILIPKTAAGPLTPLSISVRPGTAPPPGPEPEPGDSDGVTAAKRLNWGAPLAQHSDEFNYTGTPDPAKWSVGSGCWPNQHAAGTRRCADRTTVADGKLIMTGLANGDTAWMQSDYSTRYGRWEARVRSRNTGTDNGRYFRTLLIVWPDDDIWPEEGEYDFLENTRTAAPCVNAVLHYPVKSGGTQQEDREKTDCREPMSEWHNIGFEWTPDHVRGFLDGEQWFSISGGESSTRKAMQSMWRGHLTMQFDNFRGQNMTPGSYEAEWIRMYPV
ncbi:glycoside hydrolase family 16 protein [Actinoplanes sp. CA-051413]|uniref:glycoside hydrolase family 16 protein n=1 Tax=Actinoplanes sp. CA-051413 TaxID=3239899 RepID=UPI003D96B5EF